MMWLMGSGGGGGGGGGDEDDDDDDDDRFLMMMTMMMVMKTDMILTVDSYGHLTLFHSWSVSPQILL